ncbi:Protein-export protein SecB [Candidatus Micropelagos thuwalensis]|uniref:Protein-export protein SecB n=1 Tax=Candidatus Micropelagius thuwalensis TaxID=1397666 RepID=U2WSK2_9PROT|nr:DUF3604 domain-containing protein [Candidatus Micropelagos thuwalensis]ERL46538.1 Protein-export protein SecB [Candidatus Micropelagos thuwalensis]
MKSFSLFVYSLLLTLIFYPQDLLAEGKNDYEKVLLWGDLHVHSNFSFDAYSFGNTALGPDKAYEFAKGLPVKAPNGELAQLSTPLDFLLVSDHAEYLGLFLGLERDDPKLKNSALGQRWLNYFQSGTQAPISREYVQMIERQKDIELLPEDFNKSAWSKLLDFAERYNEPGVFSALIGFEWTSMINGDNLHRVVVYRDGMSKAQKMLPFSALDSPDPEDLWKFMGKYEQSTGGQVIAIPHNGNVSNGVMFSDKRVDGSDFDASYSAKRQKWEPLYEVTQVKGDAEAHPYLSPTDEYADFETWDQGNLRMEPKDKKMLQGEYARAALKNGLVLSNKYGTNPFKFGLVGGTDTHNALSTSDDENFYGKFVDSLPSEERTSSSLGDRLWDNWRLSASGYTAVWAKENTREAIFDALKRREVYATSGPRILLKFFGGWNYASEDLEAPEFFNKTAYEDGVPMGGSFTNLNSEAKPRFVFKISKDPKGSKIDKFQIIKGWVDEDGQIGEKVFTVMESADGKGLDTFVGIWVDKDFKIDQEAFYYARVLEVPTKRWSTYDQERYDVSLDPEIPTLIRERAYSSPIWFEPNRK